MKIYSYVSDPNITLNVSVIMLEVEFVIVVMVFISVEFILRKAFNNKIDTQSSYIIC